MILSVGVFLILHCNMDTTYKQSLCSIEFFCCLPSELVCIILWGYTQCDFYHIFSVAVICSLQKFFRSLRWYISSSWQAPLQLLERQWEIMVWSSGRRKIYLLIDLSRCISRYFLSASVALNILSFYQLFHDFEILCP